MKKLLMLLLLFTFARESRAMVYPDSRMVPLMNSRERSLVSLEQFFKSYDTALLKRVRLQVINPDEPARISDGDIQYMQAKNQQLIGLLTVLNPQFYKPEEMQATDEMLVLAGAIELYRQSGGGLSGRMPFPWQCIKDVILDAFDVTVAFGDILVLFESNTTWSTVRPVLWKFLRRYGGWLTVAGVVYDIVTECFKI